MFRIIDLLIRCYEFDISVFSEPWMYYPLCIPALGYLVFFFVKWLVLTAPIWIPLRQIFHRASIADLSKHKNKEN